MTDGRERAGKMCESGTYTASSAFRALKPELIPKRKAAVRMVWRPISRLK